VFNDAPVTEEGKYRVIRRHYDGSSDTSAGVNVLHQGIAIDGGVDNPNLPATMGYRIPSWATATVEDRIEAAIVHELVEVGSTEENRHLHAVRLAPETAMKISATARQILREQRLQHFPEME
jgi:hypothetical protein